MMRPWVKWCVEHKLRLIPYIAFAVLYVVNVGLLMCLTLKESIGDWKDDFKELKDRFDRHMKNKH